MCVIKIDSVNLSNTVSFAVVQQDKLNEADEGKAV